MSLSKVLIILLTSFRVFKKLTSLREHAHWLVADEPDGLFLLGGKIKNDLSLHKSILIKYPYSIGSVWSDSVIYYVWPSPTSENGNFLVDGTFEIECTETSKTVTIAEKEYICAVFHFKRRLVDDILDECDFHDYYAPGVGLVRREILKDGFLIRQTDLISYTIR